METLIGLLIFGVVVVGVDKVLGIGAPATPAPPAYVPAHQDVAVPGTVPAAQLGGPR